MTSKKVSPLRLLHAAAFALAAAGLARAQTAPTPPPDLPSNSADDQTVTLNPFEVNSSPLNGYTASRSLTGSRVAQDIKDLPFTVDVTTTEMWDDFAISPMSGSETLSTVPGMSPLENFAAYAMRGINSSYELLQDGMHLYGRPDAINTDRLEVIMGPTANIYGYTLPGGLVNAISKVPQATPQYNLGISGGDLTYARENLEATGPLLPGKLLYRAAVSKTHDEGSNQVYRTDKLDAIGGQLLWLINDQSSFRVDLSYTNERRSGRDGVLEAVTETHSSTGAASTLQDEGLAWFFPNFNRDINSEPWGYSIFRNKDLTGSYINKLNANWTLRLVGNVRAFNLFTLRGKGEWDPTTNIIWDQVPNWGFEHHHGHQMTGELVGNVDFLGISNRILVTTDYTRTVDQVGPTYELNPTVYSVANGYPGSQRIMEWLATNESQEMSSLPPLSAYTDETRNQIPANVIIGGLVSDQMKFFHDKVLLSLGGRYDVIHQIIDNLVTSTGIPQHQQAWLQAPTVQSGVNFVLPYGAELYGSYSTSFQPQTVLEDNGTAPPPIKGAGYDFGIKSDLLKNDQLFMTFGYFSLTETNILTSETIDGVVVNLLTGKIASHGLEFSLGGKVGNSLILKVGVGDTIARNAEDLSDPDDTGLPVKGISQWNVGAVAKYDFHNGWYAGSNVTYLSNYRYDDTTNVALTNVFLPSWIRWDFLGGYNWYSDGRRIRNSLSLVLKNAFNKDYMFGTDPTRGLPRGFVVSYTLAYK